MTKQGELQCRPTELVLPLVSQGRNTRGLDLRCPKRSHFSWVMVDVVGLFLTLLCIFQVWPHFLNCSKVLSTVSILGKSELRNPKIRLVNISADGFWYHGVPKTVSRELA